MSNDNKQMMVKIVSRLCVLSLTLAFFSFLCSCNGPRAEALKTIDLGNLQKANVDDVFVLRDAIPLKDGEAPFLPNLAEVSRSGDFLISTDGAGIIYLFNLSGDLIASSSRVRGHGHGEYDNILAYSYNPYSQLVEVVTPTKLLFYDTQFNFIREVSLPTRMPKEEGDGCIFDGIYDLGANLHAFLPSTASYNKHSIVIFDSSKCETVKTIDFSDDLIGYVNMQTSCFTPLDSDSIVFYPPGISKYISYLDKEDLSLRKVREICGLQHEQLKDEVVYSQYAMSSTDLMPLRFIATNDCYCFIAKEGNSLNDMSLIVISEDKPIRQVMLKNSEGMQFPLLCFSDKDYVYGLADSYTIDDYFGSARVEMPDSLEGYSNVILRYEYAEK